MSKEKNDDQEEEQKTAKTALPGKSSHHQRRISTLDNTGKFANALDALNNDVNKTKDSKPKKDLAAFVEQIKEEEDEQDADKAKDPQDVPE